MKNRDAALAKILLIENSEGNAQLAMRAPREANAPNRLAWVKDGRDVLAEIDLHQIPVVVLTTSRPVEDVTKTDDLRADCCVQEPVDLEDFITVVRATGEFRLPTVGLPPGFHDSRDAKRAPAAF